MEHKGPKRREGGWTCIHCGEQFLTRMKMQEHNRQVHKDPTKNKMAGDHHISDTPCPFCGKVFSNSSALTQHKNYCDENPNRRTRKGHAISEETKRKISEKMKSIYEGSSIWRTQMENRKSYAEQYFDDCFPDAKQNYHVDRYFLDLAWPERKCYLEVDGEQHYKNNQLCEHDIERNKRLENLGWTLISRVRWSSFQKLSKEEKENFIYQVGASVMAHKPHKLDIEGGSTPPPDRKTIIEKTREERWNIIRSSNIDFSKFGWVGQISKLFGIAPNRAGDYIKRNFPDFYKTCFQRS